MSHGHEGGPGESAYADVAAHRAEANPLEWWAATVRFSLVGVCGTPSQL
ncbi:hypothetical protein ABIA38_000506 [Embleya sp. AB8]